jgi:hypothetical protein
VAAWEGEPLVVAPEHSEIRWFHPGEVDALDLMPHLKRAIRRYVTDKA